MKKLFLFLFSFVFFVPFRFSVVSAQFPFGIGGTGSDQGRSICADGSGNVLVAGDFSGTVDFDPSGGTSNLTSNGNLDIYVAKYNSAGTLQWAFRIGGTNADYCYGITTDAGNNVLLTGSFRGSNVDFDPSGGTATLSGSGNQDIFVAKYSSSGAYIWAFKIGTSNAEYGYSVATDASSNVFVTGYFQGTADFDPSGSTANLTSSGGQDAFIAKYNSSGNYQWAFKIGTSGTESGYSITTDAAGNILVLGVFDGTADFDPSGSTANLTSSGNRDIFVAKYNTSGNYQWAFKIGGTDNDYAYGIKTDASNNVYVTGYFALTTDFDPGAGTSNLSSAGGADIFLAKYNSSGNYQWALGAGSVGNDIAYGITLDASANIFITGSFQNTVDFDPSGNTANLTNSGADDAFVAKYSSAGVYLCAFAIGSSGLEAGYGIGTDASNNVLVTGYLGGTADFDPGAGTSNISPTGSIDAYVGKYSNTCTLGPSAVDETDFENSIIVFPNPTSGKFVVQITNQYRFTDYELEIYNIYGEKVYAMDDGRCLPAGQAGMTDNGNTSTINHQPLTINLDAPSGVYFVRIKTDEGIITKKLILNK